MYIFTRMYCLINVTYCHNFCPLILFSSIGYILFLYSRVFSLLFFSAFHCLNISQSDDNNSNEITAKQTVITIIQQIFLFLLFPIFFLCMCLHMFRHYVISRIVSIVQSFRTYLFQMQLFLF